MKCPTCNSDYAYVGFSSVLCIFKACEFYNEEFYLEHLENLEKLAKDNPEKTTNTSKSYYEGIVDDPSYSPPMSCPPIPDSMFP
jgi:hypothetical protein